MAALTKSTALQTRWATANFSTLSVLGAALPGTRFETLPPLAILFKLFQFLKCLGLNSVGLGFDCVPFHSGWELVEWELKLSNFVLHAVETKEICDVVEVDDSVEVFGPQIELSLENPTDMGEPPVKLPEWHRPQW